MLILFKFLACLVFLTAFGVVFAYVGAWAVGIPYVWWYGCAGFWGGFIFAIAFAPAYLELPM